MKDAIARSSAFAKQQAKKAGREKNPASFFIAL